MEIGMLHFKAADYGRLRQGAVYGGIRDDLTRGDEVAAEISQDANIDTAGQLKVQRALVPDRYGSGEGNIGGLPGKVRGFHTHDKVLHAKPNRALIAKGESLKIATCDVPRQRRDLQVGDFYCRRPGLGPESRPGNGCAPF